MNSSTEQRLRDDLIELEHKTTSEDLFRLAQARNMLCYKIAGQFRGYSGQHWQRHSLAWY